MKLGDINKPVMQFWHGGNLDIETPVRSGKWEYGPGLYLTTHYQTAKKYAKGSRKFYRINVESGNDSSVTLIDFAKVQEFVERYIIKSKKSEILQALTKYQEGGRIIANYVITILLNYEGLKTSNANALKSFLVGNGVDYSIISNPFGWGEKMMVLFNMNKIVKTEIIKPTDKIEKFDLNT